MYRAGLIGYLANSTARSETGRECPAGMQQPSSNVLQACSSTHPVSCRHAAALIQQNIVAVLTWHAALVRFFGPATFIACLILYAKMRAPDPPSATRTAPTTVSYLRQQRCSEEETEHLGNCVMCEPSSCVAGLMQQAETQGRPW